jgi:hypothetical protein
MLSIILTDTTVFARAADGGEGEAEAEAVLSKLATGEEVHCGSTIVFPMVDSPTPNPSSAKCDGIKLLASIDCGRIPEQTQHNQTTSRQH